MEGKALVKLYIVKKSVVKCVKSIDLYSKLALSGQIFEDD